VRLSRRFRIQPGHTFEEQWLCHHDLSTSIGEYKGFISMRTGDVFPIVDKSKMRCAFSDTLMILFSWGEK